MHIRRTESSRVTRGDALPTSVIPSVQNKSVNRSDNKQRALKLIGAEPPRLPKGREKLRISRILSPSERKMLPEIWCGTQPLTTFSNKKRLEVAQFFRKVANRAPKGSAQWGFNIARARFFEGTGASPGQSAVEYARREGLPIARWPRGRRRHSNATMSFETQASHKPWQIRATFQNKPSYQGNELNH